MEDASQQFYKYVCAVCKAEGLNPDREVFITDDYRSYDQISKGQILVSWESGPFEWGVNFSLGYHENIYDPEFADQHEISNPYIELDKYIELTRFNY